MAANTDAECVECTSEQIIKSDEEITATSSADNTTLESVVEAQEVETAKTIKHPAISDGKLRDYLQEYLKLPPKARKRVMEALMYWGGWTKTSVYRKLQCPNLSPIEEVLVSSVMDRAIAKNNDGTQLEIAFEFTAQNGFILLPEK